MKAIFKTIQSLDIRTFAIVMLLAALCFLTAISVVVGTVLLILDPAAADGAVFGYAG